MQPTASEDQGIKLYPSMLASSPASMVNQKRLDLGIPNRFKVASSRFSSIKLPSALTASIDAWASTHAFNRSQAIRRLVELGLKWEAEGRQVLSGGAVAVEEM